MLTLRKTWPGDPKYKDDYEVIEDGLPIGRIYLSNATMPVQWLWFIQVHEPTKTRNGMADSLEAAKKAFKDTWEMVR